MESDTMRRMTRHAIPVLAALLAVLIFPAFGRAGTDLRELRILFTNNSNGKLKDCNCPNDPYGGLAERVGFIRDYTSGRDNALILDSGGYLGLYRVEQYAPVVFALMDEMGYDACGVGDQELFNGLGTFLDLAGEHRDKILSAVIRTKDDEPVFDPYRIFTAGGVRVGVIGVAGAETFRMFPAERMDDFAVADLDETLKTILPGVEGSCEYVVVLSQLGREGDIGLAKRWPAIDLIIGGHSQTLLEEAVRVGDCRIVQAGKGGGRVGEIVAYFREDGSLDSFRYRLVNIDDEEYPIPDDIRPMIP